MVALIQFLETTLALLPSLPKPTVDAIYYISCKQIASLMMVRTRSFFFFLLVGSVE